MIAQASNIDHRRPAAAADRRAAAASPITAPTAGIPGPTPDQLRAASGMTPTQQSEMGRAMVERLAGRLRQNPRDADGWIMLMRSRMVAERAAACRRGAAHRLAAFSNEPATQARLRQAARELGVPGA